MKKLFKIKCKPVVIRKGPCGQGKLGTVVMGKRKYEVEESLVERELRIGKDEVEIWEKHFPEQG